jgi:predicted aldo/keto reductase-like oxidoreductase
MIQHPSDWHNNTGVIRQAEEQGMGVILMHPLTSAAQQIGKTR